MVEIDDDDDDNDDDDGGVSTDEDSCFGLLSLAFKMIGLLPLPTFMMRLFTAACATDLKSASVGGFDKIDTGATELISGFTLALAATITFFFKFTGTGADFKVKGIEETLIFSCAIFFTTGIIDALDLMTNSSLRGTAVLELGANWFTDSNLIGTIGAFVAIMCFVTVDFADVVTAATVIPFPPQFLDDDDGVSSGLGVLLFPCFFFCDFLLLDVASFDGTVEIFRPVGTRRFDADATIFPIDSDFLFVPAPGGADHFYWYCC